VYSVFTSLGIDAQILPVLEGAGVYGYKNGDTLSGKGHLKSWDYSDLKDFHQYLKDGSVTLKPEYEYLFRDRFEQFDDLDLRWKILLMGRRVRGLAQLAEDLAYEAENAGGTKRTKMSYAMRQDVKSEIERYKLQGSRVGRFLHPYSTTDSGWEDDIDEVSQGQFELASSPSFSVFFPSFFMAASDNDFATGGPRCLALLLSSRYHLAHETET
jgi:hypothetical protein